MKAADLTIEWVLARTHFEQMSGCWFFDLPRRWGTPAGRHCWGGYYPSVNIEGRRTIRLSRWMLQRRLGRALGPDMCACHHCDTPPCINPDHLFEGTRADNVRDAQLKGRAGGWASRRAAEIELALIKAGDVAPKRRSIGALVARGRTIKG